jgi:hypothetical protein
MDRRGAIDRLRAELAGATAARDWSRLEAVVSELAAQLAALGGAGPWSGAERQSLIRLRAVHDQAVEACTAATDALARQLDEMRANKDGWTAYALADENAAAELS